VGRGREAGEEEERGREEEEKMRGGVGGKADLAYEGSARRDWR
jgi:hypothetical protein